MKNEKQILRLIEEVNERSLMLHAYLKDQKTLMFDSFRSQIDKLTDEMYCIQTAVKDLDLTGVKKNKKEIVHHLLKMYYDDEDYEGQFDEYANCPFSEKFFNGIDFSKNLSLDEKNDILNMFIIWCDEKVPETN